MKSLKTVVVVLSFHILPSASWAHVIDLTYTHLETVQPIRPWPPSQKHF